MISKVLFFSFLFFFLFFFFSFFSFSYALNDLLIPIALYKTVWEIPQKAIIDLAADRGAFIDQSQSLNIHIAEPNFAKLTSMHFYGWKKGLKTGMYYLRTRPAVDAIKFTVDQQALKTKSNQKPSEQVDENEAAITCSLSNPESCVMCSA